MKKCVIAKFVLFLSLFLSSCSKTDEKTVVVYTSLDQVFSDPILKDFEQETGIKVLPVYDVEASKTTGLVNRLIAEKDNPKCDVFWNSEFGRTIVLKQKGVLAAYISPSGKDIPKKFRDKDDYWTGFAARARVLVYNTNLLKEPDLPESIFELTQPKWRGKVVMAYPLFGTTATHVAAWYSVLGKEKTEKYLNDFHKNGLVIVKGNSTARDVVVEGEYPLAFTDTDDVNVALQSGKPIKMIFPDKEGLGTLFIPNTVALIKRAPHLDNAKILIDYLLSREVESKLAFADSAQIPLREGVKKPAHVAKISEFKVMEVDYDAVAGKLEEAARFSQNLFIR